MHLDTYLEFASVFKIWRVGTTVRVSYISDKLFSKLQHLGSYVSCQYAMAYDSGGDGNGGSGRWRMQPTKVRSEMRPPNNN